MKALTMLGPMLVGGAVLLGVAGPAAAQPAPSGTPEPGPTSEGGPNGHAGMHGGPPLMRPGMMRMMRPSKGARFHFSRNDGVVDVKCAEDEPMRACVDAASALLDKLAAQPAK